VLELDTIFKSAVHLSRPNRSLSIQPPSTPRLPIISPPVDSTKPSTNPGVSGNGTAKLCTDCGRRGHLVPTCFEPGGGMEDRRDEYKRDKGRFVAMLAASLEDACTLTDDSSPEPIINIPTEILDDPAIPTSDPTNFPMSSTLPQMNKNFSRDLYPMCDPKSLLSSTSAVSSPVIDHKVFLSLGARHNSCLDSGCTDHIIRDRHLFQTYDIAGAVDIGTANCGSLSAKGSGDVSFRVPHADRFVIFTMRGCLHAPDAPINLISVGALNEN
jgi:hypothetical protein